MIYPRSTPYCFAICANGDLQLHKHLAMGGSDKSSHVHVCAWKVDDESPRSVGVKHTHKHIQEVSPTTMKSITACIKGIVPQHRSPSRDVPLASTNNPAILDHLQCLICLVHIHWNMLRKDFGTGLCCTTITRHPNTIACVHTESSPNTHYYFKR